ncbi:MULTISPECIES: OsmC family protein [unclassified Exiguobacterium]|uniref:OsmC family protein n=1 Tax=unclassified Exiguobacterium TaxID=2644629 RepID=UPI000B58CE6C|nr:MULTISPECIES: OsmC family protein [unclassified Exiguobacterium]ASI35383.1 osmotically inducible protein C [Exiguobacterium sp. N4-1P]ASI37396.1 osmotically inducible protein C [Exiguobacterium sp. N4-1P]
MVEKITAVSKGMYTEGVSHGHKVIIDEPAKMGGTDEGANPLATLLVALTGCENAIANFVAKEINFDLQGIEFEVEGTLDPRGMMGDASVRPYFERITVNAKVLTSESEERVQELQHIVDSRCPVYTTMVAANVEMVPNWTKA